MFFSPRTKKPWDFPPIYIKQITGKIEASQTMEVLGPSRWCHLQLYSDECNVLMANCWWVAAFHSHILSRNIPNFACHVTIWCFFLRSNSNVWKGSNPFFYCQQIPIVCWVPFQFVVRTWGCTWYSHLVGALESWNIMIFHSVGSFIIPTD
jgi:hypothetical protein